jgi:predicted 3-demethylubiquinone-9 3-methyltransferase (glyoxalase superfamily)
MTKVTPFLMYQGKVAEEAIRFYVDVIPDSEIVHIERYGPDGPGPEGTVAAGEARLGGLTVRFYDSYVEHGFGFTPALSLFVTCADAAEVDRLAGSLGDGGGVLMPPGDYGFSPWFAWVNDRFGVSWQLNAERA